MASLEYWKGRAFRAFRRHWLTERLQYELRKTGKLLPLPEINSEIALPPGAIVIDCGANVGDVSSRCARAGATVYAFEPNPICFKVLANRFRAMPQVRCLNQAVLDRHTTLILRSVIPDTDIDEVDMSAGSTLIEGKIDDDREIRETEVECIDLAEFIRARGQRIAFLKLDIEGAEIEVVNSLLDTGAIDLVDMVVVETHEMQDERLVAPTAALRQRVADMGLASKLRLDWP